MPVQPDAGRLEAYRVPGGPGIRLDGAVTTGNVISRYYDSMLAKVGRLCNVQVTQLRTTVFAWCFCLSSYPSRISHLLPRACCCGYSTAGTIA